MTLQGYNRSPSDDDQITLIQIIEYLNRRQSVPFSAFHREVPDEDVDAISEYTLSNARSKGTKLSPVAFQAFSMICYAKCLQYHNANAAGFTLTDRFFRHVVVPFFPDLQIADPALGDNSDDTLRKFSNSNPATLSSIAKKFEHGAYIYRYAFNDSVDPNEGAHMARGYLRMEHVPTGHFSFSLQYDIRDAETGTVDQSSYIEGAAYLNGSFIFFSGIEDETEYPFFMVIRKAFKSSQNGGLILRKHPDDKGYFSSKVIIVRQTAKAEVDTEGNDRVLDTGSLPMSELPEISKFDNFEEDLLNVGNNEGKGVLTLPYRLR